MVTAHSTPVTLHKPGMKVMEVTATLLRLLPTAPVTTHTCHGNYGGEAHVTMVTAHDTTHMTHTWDGVYGGVTRVTTHSTCHATVHPPGMGVMVARPEAVPGLYITVLLRLPPTAPVTQRAQHNLKKRQSAVQPF